MTFQPNTEGIGAEVAAASPQTPGRPVKGERAYVERWRERLPEAPKLLRDIAADIEDRQPMSAVTLRLVADDVEEVRAALASGDPAPPADEDAAIADRARFLARLYSLYPEDALWEEMSPEDAYKRGQVFAARFILRDEGMAAARSPRPETATDEPAPLTPTTAALIQEGERLRQERAELLAEVERLQAELAAARSPREESAGPPATGEEIGRVEPEADRDRFFLAAVAEHGRCICVDWQTCHPDTTPCVLCRALPGDWSCPTTAHEDYPDAVETTEETTRD